jgi:hypothetical protein
MVSAAEGVFLPLAKPPVSFRIGGSTTQEDYAQWCQLHRCVPCCINFVPVLVLGSTKKRSP